MPVLVGSYRRSDVGSNGKQQGFEALRIMHTTKIDWGNGALSARGHRWVTMAQFHDLVKQAHGSTWRCMAAHGLFGYSG